MFKSSIMPILLCAVSLPLSSLAEEKAAGKPSQEASWLYLGVGMTLSPKTGQNIKYNGTSLSNTTDTDKASPQISAEFNYRFVDNSPFSLSGIVEWNKYKYKDGTTSDTQLAVLAMPKIEKRSEALSLWAGIGLGAMNTSVGEQSTTSSGITVNLKSQSEMNFCFSPRVGIDFNLSQDFKLGLYAAYTTFSGAFDVSIISSSVNTTLTDEFSRSWFAAGARVGIAL